MAVVVDAPALVVHPHPLVGDRRITEVATFLSGETLGAYIERTGVYVPSGPVVVWHNGHRVPDTLWRRLIPRTGDQVVIRARATGGGGGGDKVIRTVAFLALTIATYGIGSWGGLAAMAGSYSALAGGALMIGGSMLITALLPPPQATAAQLGTGQKYESSPTYSITGGRNRMRPWEPMAVIFGRHKVVPDLGAKPYTQQVGDDQYLNQIFHFGLHVGNIELSDFKIGNTPISNYQGVQLEVSGYDGKLGMFANNVDTLQGFALNNSDGWVTRTTPLDTTAIVVEVASLLYTLNDDGSYGFQTVDVRVQYRAVGASDWTEVGSYVTYATHYWSLQTADGAQVQMGTTNPSDHADGEVVLWQNPDDCSGEYCVSSWTTLYWRWVPHPYTLGRPWQGIAPDPGITTVPGYQITGARPRDPINRSIGWNVPRGQYEFRIWKVTGDIKTDRASNETAVRQVLCYQADDADYTGQLRVALRIKATSQLNGAVDEFSAIARARCSVWDGVEWKAAHSRTPAWWFLNFAIGKKVGDRLLYGAGLDQDQIDYESIKAWGFWCGSKDLTFDYVLDRKMSAAQMLQIIARAGRASPTWQTGKLGVVWDAADQPAVAMFGPFNIKAGSFKVDYINDDTPDEIVVNFLNDQTWQMDEVRVVVPGATTRSNPLQLDLEGCTNASMAGREANLIAASQIWHRRRVSWETDIEGWVASRGDVVQMSHDLTVWGYSGRFLSVISRNEEQVPFDVGGNTVYRTLVTVRLSMANSAQSDGSGTMMLRDPEGNMKVVTVATTVGAVEEVELSLYADEFRLPGDAYYGDVPPMDWAWFFDPIATPGRRFKITSVQPTQDSVKFEAVDDDPGYYASESNPYVHVPPKDGALLAGIVLTIAASESIADMAARIHDVRIGWVLTAAVPVDVAYTINGVGQRGLRTSETSITIQAKRGDVIAVTVTPASPTAGRGAPKTFTYTVVGAIPAPTAPEAVTATVEGAQLRLGWPASASPDIVGYEVSTTDAGWGGGGFVFHGNALSCLVDPGPVDTPVTWYVRSINAAGLYSETSASTSYTTAPPIDPVSISEVFADTSLTNATVTLDWPDVKPVFGLSAYRVSYGDVVKVAKSNTITLPADWIGARVFTVQTIDNLGNASAGLQKTITKLAPNPVTNFRAQVIDNNVLLYWDLPAKTTLPIAHVHIKKGAAWETALDVGTKDGTFTSLQELEAGNYTYWAAVVDTDNYESEPVSITAQVSQPPDFRFNASYVSDFGATKSSAVVDSGALVLPVNTTETWEQHFQTNGWGSPQDQVSAGFPIYIQPGDDSGYYEEVFDYGTILGSSQITASIGSTVLAGAPTLSMVISVSGDGVSYIDYPGSISVFATNFQYVKLRINVEQNSPGDLVKINSINVRLDAKQKTDGGQVNAVSTDPAGTIANFSNEFVDVESITLTPQGTAMRSAVYDFQDTVIGGTYSVASNVATINAAGHSLVAGQRVRLSFTSGTAQNGIYTVASVIDANSYTVAMTTPDTSGNVSTYSQGIRIYLFDAAGNRVSGAVSWAVRGY